MCHVKRDIVTIINKVTLLKEIDAVKRHSEYKFFQKYLLVNKLLTDTFTVNMVYRFLCSNGKLPYIFKSGNI